MWRKKKVYSLSHVSVPLPSYRLPSRTTNGRNLKIIKEKGQRHRRGRGIAELDDNDPPLLRHKVPGRDCSQHCRWFHSRNCSRSCHSSRSSFLPFSCEKGHGFPLRDDWQQSPRNVVSEQRLKVETDQFIADFAEKCEAPVKRKIIFQTSVFSVFYLSFGSASTFQRSDILITYGPGVSRELQCTSKREMA